MNLAKMTIDLIYSRIQATLTNTSHNTHTAKASRNEIADQSAHIPPFCTIHPWKERFTNADVQHSPSYPLVSLSNTTTCFPTVGAMQGKSSPRTGRWAFFLVSAQKTVLLRARESRIILFEEVPSPEGGKKVILRFYFEPI